MQQDLVENGRPKLIPINELAEFIEQPPTVPRMCDFEKHTYSKNGLNIPWDRCMLEAREGYAYNIYMCKVNQLYIQQLLRPCSFRTVVETT